MPAYRYDPGAGVAYARSYALYDHTPRGSRLFYYDQEDDCANFISQCVWAAYGGWIPGYTDSIAARNRYRIKKDIRQITGVWFGSAEFVGSVNWCRVEEFCRYATAPKDAGPLAAIVAEGKFAGINPALAQAGDVIQMVVSGYAPDRYGHSLYVTKPGPEWEDVLICCHSFDRADAPMTMFTQFPDYYTKLRILRFSDSAFFS